jgi:hypothetical protein
MSDVPREFVFTRYPARQGIVWLRTAYGMFKGHRAAWVLLYLGYLIAILVLTSLPFVGPFVMLILRPVLAVGLLAAAWNQERGGTPTFQHLFQGFRTNLWALLAIGAFSAGGLTVAVSLASLVDGGKMLEFMALGGSLSAEQLAARVVDGQLRMGMLSFMLFALPVVIAAWWAPALVVFQDAGAAAALAASLRTALANWKALALYGLWVFLYWSLLPSMFITFVAIAVPAPASALLVMVLLVPYWLCLATILHVSDYVSYREVFHANETLAPLSRGA